MDRLKKQATYKIGAVARLTGLSAHTLRKWEHRYGIVKPCRSEAGDRLYSRGDLRRLGLIKHLADTGMSISRIARLSADELESAWSDNTHDADGAHFGQRFPVAILGDALPALLTQGVVKADRLRLVASASEAFELAQQLDGQCIDLLVCECPGVQPGTAKVVRRLSREVGARATIVVYGFGSRANVAATRADDIVLMRAPVDAEDLQRNALMLLENATGNERTYPTFTAHGVPGRRFSSETLARVAASSPRIECECPRHLADLICSLSAFEEYSTDCQNRDAQDASLHAYLKVTAAQARILIEEALIRVAEAENINLELASAQKKCTRDSGSDFL
ncbi:MAG: MerR family transcriptional regulator [Gammaproteobacteria bacterium]|nr:MerR family transcriptional regulator [Gammaproteobacteria bacterium]NIR84496.1 MerR family transcriptional regulator [Gammaproteobacteria bacterium]NIR90399.1 MerR family transcriptional regulator [Gammaproteobacteria bacterium]NIV52686.1 MerR family transcriptional regulator [Gammaproteobacteria bacterium]NIV75739.1 MerR family transcriptional regulator [Gammaproteobacteria bacterium]